MSWLARLFWAVLALMVFFFAVLAVNQDKVALQFVTWRTPEVSVFWWILIAFALGLLLGLFGITVSTMRLSVRNRRLSKKLGNAESELTRIRNISVPPG